MKNRNSTRPEDCTCRICGKKYARSDALKRHIKTSISCKTETDAILAKSHESAARPQPQEPTTVKKRKIEAQSLQMEEKSASNSSCYFRADLSSNFFNTNQVLEQVRQEIKEQN